MSQNNIINIDNYKVGHAYKITQFLVKQTRTAILSLEALEAQTGSSVEMKLLFTHLEKTYEQLRGDYTRLKFFYDSTTTINRFGFSHISRASRYLSAYKDSESQEESKAALIYIVSFWDMVSMDEVRHSIFADFCTLSGSALFKWLEAKADSQSVPLPGATLFSGPQYIAVAGDTSTIGSSGRDYSTAIFATPCRDSFVDVAKTLPRYSMSEQAPPQYTI